MAITWALRDDFFFTVELVEHSISRAKRITGGPTILADHGNVAGSGGSTDVPAVLAEVIRQDLKDACAGPIWDLDTVNQMISAGVGTEVTVQLIMKDVIHRSDI